MSSLQISPSLVAISPGGVIAVGVILPLISLVAVGLRFYARRWQHLKCGADDWTILASAGLITILGVIAISGATIGALGQHSTTSATNFPGHSHGHNSSAHKADKIMLAYSVVEKPAFALVEISMVLLYRRVFKGRVFSRVAVATCATLLVVSVAFLVTSAMQCGYLNWQTALSLSMSSQQEQQSCVAQELVALAFSIMNLIINIFIILLPIPIIWKLDLDNRTRLCVWLIFVLSGCSITVSIIRMAILLYFTYPSAAGYRDSLGIVSTTVVLSMVELGIGVVATSIPTFRNLLAVYLDVEVRGGSVFLSRYPPEITIAISPSVASPISPTAGSVKGMGDHFPVLDRRRYDRMETIEEREKDSLRQTSIVSIADSAILPPPPLHRTTTDSSSSVYSLQRISDAAADSIEAASSRASTPPRPSRTVLLSEMEAIIPAELDSGRYIPRVAAPPERPLVYGTLRQYDARRQCWS